MFKRCGKRLLFVGSLVLIIAANASAANRPFALTLTPQVGVMVFERKQDLDPGLTGGLALGYNFGAHWGAEGVFTFTSAGPKAGGSNVDVTTAHLDLLYHFRPKQRLVPYLSLGFGGLELKANGAKDGDLLAGYGVGLKYFLSEGVALRLDLKHLFDINFNDPSTVPNYYSMLAATAGVSFQFGGKKMAQLIIDSDADGIVDVVDHCPDTPAGVNVDEAGCPLQKTPEKIADRDQDGVADNLDLCPDTATGVAVDGTGCPVVTDKDHDGVMDAQDACPDTPAKTVVDARGCPVVVLPEPAMTFDLEYLPNAIEVSSAFAVEMQRMMDFVKAHPGRRFVIEGHTDSVGNDADNLKLSLQRAEKIKAYLVEKMGVPASLLEARGFGESNPVADNNTQDGRRQNRRVVIITIPQ
jgi:OmpA-OmpF porin, OOP family